ncbi:MAG: META domain-containing protein [Pseudoalteromonas sp.]|uniref:META domain-containing protein n=3 Tax=Pseudoalteromonas TaxID=53246 RepID=UPI003F96D363
MFKRKPSSMLKSVAGLSFLATGALLLSGCNDTKNTAESTQVESTATITAEVSYLDRSMVAPNSQLKVTLVDVSKMDTKATTISQQVIDLNGAPPYTVDLVYDTNKINKSLSYSISARIENNGELLYTTTSNNDPFAADAQTNPYKIVVTKVNQKPDVDLANTYWKAITLAGDDVTVTTKEPFIQFSNDDKAHGFLGCNNFSGSYKVSEQTVTFDHIAATKKMCHENMDQEAAMSSVLNNATQWHISGESLILKDKEGEQLATFKATYFN